MKKIVVGILCEILLLTACGQVSSTTPTALISASQTSIVSNTTPTPLPSKTPREPRNDPTSTSVLPTPLPTIPTFTPTFDASTIVTDTPALKTECPNTNLDITNYQIDFELYPSGNKLVGNGTINSIMKFLNSGGKIESLIRMLSDIKANFSYQDITNDNIPDLILVSGSLFQSLSIIYCFNQHYIRFPNEGDDQEALFGDQIQFDIQDLNRDDIQDVLTIDTTPAGLSAKIWEWNGQSFVDLTPIDAFSEGVIVTTVKLSDVNNDGISELFQEGVLVDAVYPGQPHRTETSIYYWNGKVFAPMVSFSNPQYRFQAIQDADREVLYGKYALALSLYQDTIFSDKLDWWSKEKFESSRDTVINSATPSALIPDLTEYPRLAAYAYYRIMLLHIVQGHEADASTVYKTLQQKFGNDSYGQPYVEMATAFWNAHQSTHKMYDGCAAAIEYAAEHPEILTPLGSDYHGAQGHIYVPADVCPFR